jgi:hypothetical protein
VEAVQRWRLAIFHEEKAEAQRQAAAETTDLIGALRLQRKADAMRVPRRVPFIYNGENILLSLPYVCEWLSGVPELAGHYGADFAWHRNPFLRGVTLDERAVTPRCATRRVKVGEAGGEEIEEVVPSLLEMRVKEEGEMEVMQAKLDKAGFWWPGVNADKRHVARIRAAEKEMLEEEREHGQRIELSFLVQQGRARAKGR